MLKFVRFISVGLFFFLTAGCSLDARIDFSSVLSKGAVQEKVMMPGMSLTLEPTGGTAPFVYAPTSSGFLDTTTGIYTVPINAPIVSEIVDVTDAVGEQFQVKVKVRGFSEHRVIPMPQGADDQNFPTDAVWLPSGELFISAIGSDYMGERWAVYRSTDVGATWTRVDQFMGMQYEGESFPMAMAGNANAVFTCGYAYSYNWEPGKPSSMWYVRRSLDRGLTWETADEFGVGSEDDFVCSDIAVAPGTDSVYATGHIGNKWAIRESRDNGTTWATIYEG
ncbi:MAG TPA: hypothetical protein PL182_03545, partial [Pseudobdellovibrionaceae bacterium]|nr:hypothetical protein [Pseudobdellovibrionaceae bacterium]